MNRKAENAIRKKNLFLSNMSHEVRTPLNAIVGFSTLMASEEIEVDEVSRKEYCEIIRINSYQLLKLINDIIDFSDFDEDNISMTIKGQDAVKICREVIETVAASYKLQVELRFDTSLTSLMIDTDDSRLRQVLINLLVNATKFTTQGSIVLRLERSIDDADMALFSVTDTGCGIPLEKQKLIFERFEKLNDFVQGTGLGLSICLLILKRLKGKIWIDDNAGARTVGVSDGREALDTYMNSDANEYDVILLDIMMPVMDGLETAEKIRKSGREDAGTVIIIAMSANAFYDDIERSIKAGMNTHIAKPIDADELVNIIARQAGR